MAPKPQYLAGKGADVIRVLLTDYPKAWALRELAERSGVSLSWVSEISQALITDRLALRDSQRGELRVMAPEDLFARWTVANDFSSAAPVAEFHTAEEDITKFMALFGQTRGPDYVFTGLAAALKAAPHVRPTNIRVYVRSLEDARQWARLLNLLPVESSGNVKFYLPQSPGVFYGQRKIDNVNVVSDVQLYAELYHYPARGEEASREVLKSIETKWQIGRRGVDKSDGAEWFSSEFVNGWHRSLTSRDGKNEYLVGFYDPAHAGKDTRKTLIRLTHFIQVPGKKMRESHILRFVIDRSNRPIKGKASPHHITLDDASKNVMRECPECSKYMSGLDQLSIPSTSETGQSHVKIERLESAGEVFFEILRKALGYGYYEESG